MSNDSSDKEVPLSASDQPIHPGPPPGLLRLVKVLGVVLILLFVILIGGIIWKATHRAPPPVLTDVVMDLGIDLATVRHLQLDGDRLALSTDKELLVVDIKNRKVILRSFKP